MRNQPENNANVDAAYIKGATSASRDLQDLTQLIGQLSLLVDISEIDPHTHVAFPKLASQLKLDLSKSR